MAFSQRSIPSVLQPPPALKSVHCLSSHGRGACVLGHCQRRVTANEPLTSPAEDAMFPFRVVWVNTLLPSFKVHHFQATAKMLLSLQRHIPAPDSIVYDLSIPPTSISDDNFRKSKFICTVNKPFSRPGHFGSSLKCLFSHCYLGEFCVVSPLTSTTAYDVPCQIHSCSIVSFSPH